MGPYPPRVPLAVLTPANQQSANGVGGVHTVRGGDDPGGHYFRPRFVEAVHVWKDFLSGDSTLFSPGAADYS